MSDTLAAELPPVKPWDQRARSLSTLAGGATSYLDTLRWVLQKCEGGLEKGALVEQYRLQFGLSDSTAGGQVSDLHTSGFLTYQQGLCVPTESACRWLELDRSEIAIGTLHANVRLIGELLDEVRNAQTRKELHRVANEGHGFGWQKDSQVAYRLNWLRSAGFVQLQPGNTYQATSAGLEFLECIDLHQPDITPQPPSPPPPFKPPSFRDPSEIAQRLKTLSSDGSRHKEFEEAVRDAFEFLGFEADHLSGSGQTDVLLTGTRADGLGGKSPSSNWRYRVTVDSKAAKGGRLTSNQVNWPALEKHREQHNAQFSLLVGPGPGGQLLQFAADRDVGVLNASELSALCEAHATVPLATSAYFALFADGDGKPRGGLVDTSVVESARAQQVLRQQLLAQVFHAVEAIAHSFKPPDAGLVHFNLSQANSGRRISESMIAEALELLSCSWLSVLAPVSDESASTRYVPAAPRHIVSQRLRWLAEAFDAAAGDESEKPEAG